MKRSSNTIGKQMARLYIKRYSSNPQEYTQELLSDNLKNDSISLFPKPNSSKENIELFDLKGSKSFENHHSANNSFKYFDKNKMDLDNNSINGSTKSLSSMGQPLLIENFPKIQQINGIRRYKVVRYDENCIEESKIEYIE